MSFLTDILDSLSGANKTHEELNSFVNTYINNIFYRKNFLFIKLNTY
jgi:hypothetical protein